MNYLSNEGKQELIETIITVLNDRGEGLYACDLHNECFNMDYFIIGRYQAEQWISNNYTSLFAAIDIIKTYEENNFGEITTDLSEPENVCNMLVYILGEEILNECETMKDNWDNKLNAEIIKELITELNNI